MFKFVCRGRKPTTAFLRFFFHSNLDRLAEIAAETHAASPAEVLALAREHNAIVQDLCIKGVWRRTGEGRLPETERVICEYLENGVPAAGDRAGPMTILDVGASDGSTTLDLLDRIRRRVNRRVEIYLADISTRLVRYRKGLLFEYRTTDGEPAMVRYGRIGHRLPKSEYEWDWISNLLARAYMGMRRWREGMVPDTDISLVNPRASLCPEIRVTEMDCFQRDEAQVGQFDVVRASNVLSPRYFSEMQIETAIRNLHDYLRDGGALVVSRNENRTETERGSIWQKHRGGFRWRADFGGGSELKMLVARITGGTARANAPRQQPERAMLAMRARFGS